MEMIAHRTSLDGVLLIEPRVIRDERGFFLESYHRQTFAGLGIADEFVQDNHSRSIYGVLRGLHYQDMSAPMAKLVRCTIGRIYDVAVDLRFGSPTFGQWHGVELNPINMYQLYVPVGFGHGFVTISDVAEVQYKCTCFYTPAREGAVLWNDPILRIDWPVKDPLLSRRDQSANSFQQYREQPAFYFDPQALGQG